MSTSDRADFVITYQPGKTSASGAWSLWTTPGQSFMVPRSTNWRIRRWINF